MKKKFIYTALASVMLLCSACGTQNGTPSNETITNENAAETSNTANVPTTDGNAETTDNTEQSISVSIDLQTEEINETAEDGTSIYASLIIYPVVSIEGNEAAAEKINADIQARVDAFRADTSALDMAKEDYQYTLAEESEYPFSEYSSDLYFTVARDDSNVISFVVTYSEYTGGAHPNSMTIGVNYSPRTGELIDFTELSENADSFHTDTFTFIQELAASKSYQERFFPDTSAEIIESALYADEKWYFSTSGLVFISDPYVLGPYASGMITFTIPYQDLEEMELKEDYRYEGNLTVKLEDGNSYTIDINEDGKDDTIEIAISIPLTQTTETAGAADAVSTYFFRYEKDGSVSSAGMTRGDVTDPL